MTAGDFNNNLREDIFKKFKAKSSKLPAHFTIKAPFEYDGDIRDLERAIEKVCIDAKEMCIRDRYWSYGLCWI